MVVHFLTMTVNPLKPTLGPSAFFLEKPDSAIFC